MERHRERHPPSPKAPLLNEEAAPHSGTKLQVRFGANQPGTEQSHPAYRSGNHQQVTTKPESHIAVICSTLRCVSYNR